MFFICINDPLEQNVYTAPEILKVKIKGKCAFWDANLSSKVKKWEVWKEKQK